MAGPSQVLGTEMESIWAAMLELLLIIHSVKYIISRPRDRLGPPALLLPHAGHSDIGDPRVLADRQIVESRIWTGLNWSSVPRFHQDDRMANNINISSEPPNISMNRRHSGLSSLGVRRCAQELQQGAGRREAAPGHHGEELFWTSFERSQRRLPC